VSRPRAVKITEVRCGSLWLAGGALCCMGISALQDRRPGARYRRSAQERAGWHGNALGEREGGRHRARPATRPARHEGQRGQRIAHRISQDGICLSLPFPFNPLSSPAITEDRGNPSAPMCPMLSSGGIEEPSRQAPNRRTARRVKFGHGCGDRIAGVIVRNGEAQPCLAAARPALLFLWFHCRR